MSVTAAIALITELVVAAPQIAKTGADVINLVNDSWAALKDAYGDADVSSEEITQLVAQIVANSADIQEID